MTDRLTPDEHIRLWDSFRTGSPGAFAQLYDLFAADLYRYGYNLIRNRQLVEDSLHELFLHIHDNRTRLGATDNIRFYLYRALRRRLLDAVARLNKLDSDGYGFEQAEFSCQPYEQTLVEAQMVEQQNLLVRAQLNNLPKRQKELLYLVYMKGLTYQQAAEVMGISLKSVYNTINIALTTLRTLIHDSAGQRGVSWGLIGIVLGCFIGL